MYCASFNACDPLPLPCAQVQEYLLHLERLLQLQGEMRSILMAPQNSLPFLQPGRLVRVLPELRSDLPVFSDMTDEEVKAAGQAFGDNKSGCVFDPVGSARFGGIYMHDSCIDITFYHAIPLSVGLLLRSMEVFGAPLLPSNAPGRKTMAAQLMLKRSPKRRAEGSTSSTSWSTRLGVAPSPRLRLEDRD